jgi:hypothetical protein
VDQNVEAARGPGPEELLDLASMKFALPLVRIFEGAGL